MPEENTVNFPQLMLENIIDIDSFLLDFLLEFPTSSEAKW